MFGSVARGDAASRSDIDVVVQLDPAKLGAGFAYFGALEDLRAELATLVGSDVDLIVEPVQSERLRAAIAEDAVRAF